jgi:hypothetical protein
MMLDIDERVPNKTERFDDSFYTKYWGTAHRTGVKFIDSDTAIIAARSIAEEHATLLGWRNSPEDAPAMESAIEWAKSRVA